MICTFFTALYRSKVAKEASTARSSTSAESEPHVRLHILPSNRSTKPTIHSKEATYTTCSCSTGVKHGRAHSAEQRREGIVGLRAMRRRVER